MPTHIIDVLSTFPEVISASPIVEGRTFLRSGFTEEAVSLQGIDLDLHLRTTDFAKQVTKGSVEDFRKRSQWRVRRHQPGGADEPGRRAGCLHSRPKQ